MNRSAATSKTKRKPFISLVIEIGLMSATTASSNKDKGATAKQEPDSRAQNCHKPKHKNILSQTL